MGNKGGIKLHIENMARNQRSSWAGSESSCVGAEPRRPQKAFPAFSSLGWGTSRASDLQRACCRDGINCRGSSRSGLQGECHIHCSRCVCISLSEIKLNFLPSKQVFYQQGFDVGVHLIASPEAVLSKKIGFYWLYKLFQSTKGEWSSLFSVAGILNEAR